MIKKLIYNMIKYIIELFKRKRVFSQQTVLDYTENDL